MIVSSKIHPNHNVLYAIALDFVELSRLTKFRIGVNLDIVDNYDTDFSEKEIEFLVFSGAMRKGLLSEFANEVYKESLS